MSYSDAEIWLIIVIMGIGTFLIRFSFLGLIGDRPMPAFVLRLLRYTPVAVLPGMVAPLVLWPGATDGQFDPVRMLAAMTTVAVGVLARDGPLGILGGGGGPLFLLCTGGGALGERGDFRWGPFI